MDELRRALVQQQLDSRQNFEDFDKLANDSVNKVLSSFAKLAEEKPEEVFGLKPTRRDRFFIQSLLDPAVLRSLSDSRSGPAEDLAGLDPDDVTGGNPALIGLALQALTSEGGAKIVEEVLNHIRAEKNFIKETGSEIVNKIGGLFD